MSGASAIARVKEEPGGREDFVRSATREGVAAKQLCACVVSRWEGAGDKGEGPGNEWEGPGNQVEGAG